MLPCRHAKGKKNEDFLLNFTVYFNRLRLCTIMYISFCLLNIFLPTFSSLYIFTIYIICIRIDIFYVHFDRTFCILERRFWIHRMCIISICPILFTVIYKLWLLLVMFMWKMVAPNNNNLWNHECCGSENSHGTFKSEIFYGALRLYFVKWSEKKPSPILTNFGNGVC